jgi:single-stranded DNA-binding protein
METLNLAVLSGNVGQDASLFQIDGVEWCSFPLTTYRVIKNDSGKARVKEDHIASICRPGTIAKYLTKGKSVIVQGRLAPVGSKYSVVATSLTFPGNRGQDA